MKAKGHRLAPDVDLEYLAKVTVGNNGADLETLALPLAACGEA